MGTYNVLITKMQCPRCNQNGEQEIEIYFGNTSKMLEFKISDKYLWCVGKEIQNGGRPENGNLDGEGYTECKFCKKDFFVNVKVRNDVIEGFELDSTKKPYIVD